VRLDNVGKFTGSFDGRIDTLSDGVEITLMSDDPEKKPLPLRANKMKFDWPEKKGTKPSRIILEGKVVVEHPLATVHAEKADWNFEQGILVFTGNPVMSTEQVKELRGERIILNFKENRFEVEKGRAKEIRLNAPEAAEGAEGKTAPAPPGPALKESDIADWKGFLAKFVAQAKAGAPSPGKRVAQLLDAKTRDTMLSSPADMLLKNKGGILKQLNRVLANPKLYDAACWQGIALDADAQALLAQTGLAPPDQMKLNRRLLEAAYSEFLAKP
jgi:hypothetical protein